MDGRKNVKESKRAKPITDFNFLPLLLHRATILLCLFACLIIWFWFFSGQHFHLYTFLNFFQACAFSYCFIVFRLSLCFRARFEHCQIAETLNQSAFSRVRKSDRHRAENCRAQSGLELTENSRYAGKSGDRYIVRKLLSIYLASNFRSISLKNKTHFSISFERIFIQKNSNYLM